VYLSEVIPRVWRGCEKGGEGEGMMMMIDDDFDFDATT
jgi:hypothetical protein